MDKSFLIVLAILLAFIAAALAFFYKNKFGKAPVKYIPHFLGLIFLAEIVALLINYSPILYNVWFYNFMGIGEFYFYSFLFYNLIEKNIIKKIILFLVVLNTLIFIYNFVNIFDSWQTPRTTYASFSSKIFIILYIFGYLLELFQSDKVLDFHKYFMFWFSIGVLFYNTIMIPYEVAMHELGSIKYIGNKIVSLITLTPLIVTFIMYGFIIYGILWILRPQKL